MDMTIPVANDGESLEIELTPSDRIDNLEAIWTDLESRADGSFFLSWQWIGTWLASLPPTARAHVLMVRRGNRVVGLALVCPRTIWRFGVLRTRRWLLHESGERTFDRLFVEYNGILADRDCADAVLSAGFGWLARQLSKWDELILGGLDTAPEKAIRQVAERLGHSLQVRLADSSHLVDLDKVRTHGGDYLATLGKSTRAAVRRASRLYAERGALEYRVAGSVEEALADFRALEVLHQASWVARGEPGSFANPAFRPFHERLIATGVPTGTVRLCRISAGGKPIGFLYNFAHRGRVMNYQGGFAFEADNRLKPGLVSHLLAVEDTLKRGERCYDFMATSAGHKPQLSNATQPMNWIALSPSSLGLQIDATLRQIKAGLWRVRKYGLRVPVRRILGNEGF